MTQEQIWEREYQNSKLVTKDDKPQTDTLDFFKYLKRGKGIALSGLRALDLGCGTGRNSNYLALEGSIVTGIEISSTALRLAIERAKELNLTDDSIDYIKGDIGGILPFENKESGRA